MLAWLVASLLCITSLATVRVSIMEIQGRAHVSPYNGDTIVTQGVVTAITPGGYYLQDPVGDGDTATSDGVFVFAPSDWSVRPGDLVEVDGTVTEFLPGDNADNLTLTTIDAAGVVILARGRPLPARTVVGGSGRRPPQRVIEDDALSEYQPSTDGLDFYESLEGMRVGIDDARAVGPADGFGDVWVVPAGATTGKNARGGVTAQALDANPERMRIAGAVAAAGAAVIPFGARLGDVTGIMNYGFGSYELLPDPIAPPTGAPPAPGNTVFSGDAGHLTVASFNVRNLEPLERSRAGVLARIIVSSLGAPDVLALEEVQDDSGPIDDGVVTADATYALLIDAIEGAGGPRYESREVAPIDGADGGEPGGNIRVAFLFRPDRVTFVDRADTSTADTLQTTHPVAATNGGVRLTRSPGRVDPANPAWTDTRKPLAGEFVCGDARVFVIAVHFRSKSGSSPSFGSRQPPLDAGAAQRADQARVVRAFVNDLLRLDGHARVAVLGDFNDDGFSLPLAIVEEGGALRNLARSLPAEERYSYLFEGNSHEYDHILVSPALRRDAAFDIVHVNAEYAGGASDHDPVLARLSVAAPSPPPAETPAVAAVYPNPSSGAVDIVTGEAGGSTTIAVYDVRGARVRTLTAASATTARWDGNDDAGRRVVCGVYFIRVVGSSGEVMRRAVRVR